jgi:hypothetical protein
MRVGRHRHAVNVRVDGLATVLGVLPSDRAVMCALLVDVGSGMVLDSCGGGDGLDSEELGAAQGELMRLAFGPATGNGAGAGGPASNGDCEVLVNLGGQRHLVLRRVRDPHGDLLVLSVLVEGAPRELRRVRRRLREVSAAALTAGPTVSLRPVGGAWVPATVEERTLPTVRPRAVPASSPGPDSLEATQPPAGYDGLVGPDDRPGPADGPSEGGVPAMAARDVADLMNVVTAVPGNGAPDRDPLGVPMPRSAPDQPNGHLRRPGAAEPGLPGERPPAPPSALPPPAARTGA